MSIESAPKLEIWSTARLLVRAYPDIASAIAFDVAYEDLRAGDVERFRIWLLIFFAVVELQNPLAAGTSQDSGQIATCP
jgi:hypothetical protein